MFVCRFNSTYFKVNNFLNYYLESCVAFYLIYLFYTVSSLSTVIPVYLLLYQIYRWQYQFTDWYTKFTYCYTKFIYGYTKFIYGYIKFIDGYTSLPTVIPSLSTVIPVYLLLYQVYLWLYQVYLWLYTNSCYRSLLLSNLSVRISAVFKWMLYSYKHCTVQSLERGDRTHQHLLNTYGTKKVEKKGVGIFLCCFVARDSVQWFPLGSPFYTSINIISWTEGGMKVDNQQKKFKL